MSKTIAYGGTHTYAAIAKANAMFQARPSSRSTVPKIMVIFTDGLSSNPQKLKQRIESAKGGNITIWSIGIGNNVSNSIINMCCYFMHKFAYFVEITMSYQPAVSANFYAVGCLGQV